MSVEDEVMQLKQLEDWMKRIETKGMVKNRLVNKINSEIFEKIRSDVKKGSSINDICLFTKDANESIAGNSIEDVWKHHAYVQVRRKIWSIQKKVK